MDSRQKLAEQQSLSVTRRLSGKLKASGYGDVNIPEDWVFITKIPSAVIDRLRTKGSVWQYWEQTTIWTSDFEGWYVPPWLAQLVPEVTRLLEEENQQRLAEAHRWVASRQHEKEVITVWVLGDPSQWRQDGIREEHFNTKIPIPEGWTLLRAGDQLLTKRVKERGCYWVCKEKRGQFAHVLGVFAPLATIEEERQKVQQEKASESYQQRLKGQRKRRELQEEKYRRELAGAMLKYLNFAPEYSELASEIVEEAATMATEVGSGKVGRSRKLLLEEKAKLAVRAYIRHNHTDYEEQLSDVGFPLEPYDLLYREIKSEAALAVDAFLSKHRKAV